MRFSGEVKARKRAVALRNLEKAREALALSEREKQDVFELHRQGLGVRKIAKILRHGVKEVRGIIHG